jgi:hypothetical protein
MMALTRNRPVEDGVLRKFTVKLLRLSDRRARLLEMQVIICELVGKFSFALPENDRVRTRLANTLLPTVSSWEKAAPLCITRIL